MSHAWLQLHKAVNTLVGGGDRRQRLAVCLCYHLSGLHKRDLPVEIHRQFDIVRRSVPLGAKVTVVKEAVAGLRNEQVDNLARLIVMMFDATARYEPIGHLHDSELRWADLDCVGSDGG